MRWLLVGMSCKKESLHNAVQLIVIAVIILSHGTISSLPASWLRIVPVLSAAQ